jgi:hypothetical protein
MFRSETTTFITDVGVKTLKAVKFPFDITPCIKAFPRLAQAYAADKPDHGAIAKSTILAYLELGASLLDVKPLKIAIDDPFGIFRGESVFSIIDIGVACILEEFPEALAAAESYAIQTEAYFKRLSGRRAKKTDRINVAKANVGAFLVMFPSPTIADVETFLDAGAFVKPKAPRKRAKKVESASGAEASGAEASGAEASGAEASEAEASGAEASGAEASGASETEGSTEKPKTKKAVKKNEENADPVKKPRKKDEKAPKKSFFD